MAQPHVVILFLFVGIYQEKSDAYDAYDAYDLCHAWHIIFGGGRVNPKHPNFFPSTPPPHLTFKPP